MAQASSVQREPSMEEILASIRRIIEDSDGGRKSVDDQASSPAADVPTPSKAEVESFRTELGTGAPATLERKAAAAQPIPSAGASRPAPSAVAEFTPKPFRLAEVQAQVAREAAAARPADTRFQPAVPADLEDEIAAELEQEMAGGAAARPIVAASAGATAAAAPGPVEQRASTDAARPAVSGVAEQTARPVVSAWRREPAQTGATPGMAQPSAATPASPAAPEAVPARPQVVPSAALPQPAAFTHPEAPSLQRPPIISPTAGRQVAASFGELSEAFAARSKKSFDELAEQMLRPMLQEWLDNNLPLLVEKLVREEIERVARGS